MARTLGRGMKLVMTLTFCALLPSRSGVAQSTRELAFTVPATPSGSIQIQQVQEFVHCPQGGHARAIIVQNFESFAGALVVLEVTATPPGVVQFSFSLDGPFTDTLQVPVQLDGTGSGVSDVFFVKGVNPGVALVEGCSILGCIPTPFQVTVVGIAGIDFEVLDSPLDGNPNIGGGLRIYPDRETPHDAMNRRAVRVQVFTIPQVSGLPINFRSFDVDDPSSDDRPVDPNGSAGDDNRGEPPASGSLNATVTETDASGIAETVLTVSMQPGDNFKVAAACDPVYLEQLVVEGVELKDADGNFLPTDQGRSTEMLTVWRRVHVEVDSMGNVEGNLVAGVVTNVVPNPKSMTTEVKVDQPLEAHRFEKGVLEIAGVGLFGVTDNDKSSLTLPGILTEGVGDSFTLWDDDDFNGDDSDPLLLDGDNNENVTVPSVSLLGDSGPDGICDYSFINVFGAAYVCPVFDIGDNNDFVPFVLNVPDATASALIALYDFDNSATEADPTFWTVYLLGAYQETTVTDNDPTVSPKKLLGEKNAVRGAADGITGQGASIFMETVADTNRRFSPAPIGCNVAATVAHEIGHLFGGEHSDGGIMAIGCDRAVVFSAKTIATIRDLSHP